MPTFGDTAPATLAEARDLVREWFADGHWIQGNWIKTPDGAYSGTCTACLHGACTYLGGGFGKELSKRLRDAGYTVEWNDREGRTVEEVIAALNAVDVAEVAD